MFRVLSLADKDEWDSIVKSFNDYDVYYLNGYVSAFKIHGDGEPILLFFQNLLHLNDTGFHLDPPSNKSLNLFHLILIQNINLIV